MSAKTEAGPLAGVRVLDLSSVIMGPVCTQILAGYGADVVKIEPPEGDIMRHAGAKKEPGMGAMFLHANRNKRSVVVDLKKPQGVLLLKRLVPRFDVFVHNLRPDAIARLGLGYEAIRPLRADIVYAELTGYDQRGPYAARPAFDDIIQAETGIADLFARHTGGEPRYLPALIADRMTGISAAHRVLASLYRRRATGEGEYLNVSMFETMAAFTLADHLGGQSFDPPAGPIGYSRLLTPHRKPYKTKDGHIAVVVYNDKHWRSFFDVIGRTELFAADARFQTAAYRAENYDFIYAWLAEVLATRATGEWLALLQQAEVPCAPVQSIEQLIDDPHLRETGFFARLPDGAGHQQSASDNATTRHGMSPHQGEHTRAFLAAEGFDEQDIHQLATARVVACMT
jgi:crotonobetainyl-CoA:carnitine CoA-transferase CaiB-like acyl-CoA transferase